MRYGYIVAMLLSSGLSTPALADHNSPMGEGWANMPNDIHNTRIETRGDDTAFRDFVRQGAGSDSVNRNASSNNRARMQSSPFSRNAKGQNRGARRMGGRSR